MIQKMIRTTGIFALLFLPSLILSFFAYTVLHQFILFIGMVIAGWLAFYFSNAISEKNRLNQEIFLQSYELKTTKEALDSCLIGESRTQAHNERFLNSKLTDECNRAKRYHRHLSCLLIGVDAFEELSITRGTIFAQAVFQELLRFLKESTRSIDSSIRYGDEQIVVILPETQLNQAEIVARRIQFSIEKKTFMIDRETLKITVSIGILCFDPELYRGRDEMMSALHQTLLAAKRKGPNQIAGIAST